MPLLELAEVDPMVEAVDEPVEEPVEYVWLDEADPVEADEVVPEEAEAVSEVELLKVLLAGVMP
jgi:hypothetical protein